MRVCLPALLLTLALLIQTSIAEDIYWEGEGDASNEFLEVKEPEPGLVGHLRRWKRQLFWPFSSQTEATPEYESVTDDTYDVNIGNDRDDDDGNEGSGSIVRSEPETKEKTIRVTFVVMEPYLKQYSDRDSDQFKNISRGLADAVNALFDDLPGTQRASLVRIQSRLSDEFSCKVTMEIMTSGYEDTKEIATVLKDHIRLRRQLGSYTVDESEFNSTDITDPGNASIDCAPDELKCDEDRCLPASARCDGRQDCNDRTDEASCPGDDRNEVDQETIKGDDDESEPPYRTNLRGDDVEEDNEDGDENIDDGDLGDIGDTRRPDSIDEGVPETTTIGLSTFCASNEFRCDNTRCLPLANRCDNRLDCDDGTDEDGCPPKTCGADDFKCNNGKCIEGYRRCNRVVDCPFEEDEENCECRSDEFRCVSDGFCIELRKRCDGVNHCNDNSDEANCVSPSCPPGTFTCEFGSSIPCARQCDGRQECDNGEDERDCKECNHKCDGRCIEDQQICDGIADCTDGSDEISCDPCDGPYDFRCQNKECINIVQRCNGLSDCSDSSDEMGCNNTMLPRAECNENQFQCRDGSCINIEFSCDGNFDCDDNSDEDNCRCKENEWQCRTGQCIPSQAYCDGRPDCSDRSDEENAECRDPWAPPIETLTTTRGPLYPYPYEPSTQFPTTLYPTAPPEENPYSSARPSYPDNREDTSGGSSESLGPRRPGRPGSGRDYTALALKTYPTEQNIRNEKNGGDVVFLCRDEGLLRTPVRWVREGGKPLKPGSIDRNGRLEVYKVSVSDSGTYICQAPAYLGYPGAEVRVTLIVDPTPRMTSTPFHACRPTEATCANGQCIPKSAVCNGKIDCDDRSDEDSCTSNGKCEPNEYQCANGKCVLKTWVCDSENDCGDNSDEQQCVQEPGKLCSPVEFSCATEKQCIPRSYHCDGHFDCNDRSDEIGCAPVHVTRPPAPANVRLNPGETLVLVCEAVGVPMPLISWRLNWGHVPPKCTSTSINGVGTLTCNDMQPEDSGAYSCEAINRSGTTFAAPDSIVYVNKTDVCPTGYFNSEARSQNECIRCFCFGESNVCRSADLFTYNMPTPLGEGGTRLIGVKQTYRGDIQIDTQPITERYYYQSVWNGATVTTLDRGRFTPRSSDAQPFLTLPESYNGNQLTSYGGHIRYNLSPHSTRFSSDTTPDIIIKGKYQTLIYNYRGEVTRNTYIQARLTPGNWVKPTARGQEPASREDIMMALDNVEMILLRAGINNAGVNITNFAMESAQHINVGLGSASLVEECTCPPGYEGLSCQKCASDYVRVKNGPWLGDCVPKRTCPEGTYGDPNSGYDCKPCPCPLTNRGNQFARTCSVGPSGDVVCDCFPGYEGPDCRYCSANYIGNPLIPGDSCKPKPTDNCNPTGTNNVRLPDECVCKENVQGRYCDECKNGSFYLSNDFRHGCALCFCSGVSQQCSSNTNLRRKSMTVSFNVPNIVNQVRVYSSVPSSVGGAIKYNAPVETSLQPELIRGAVSLSSFDRSRPSIYYWSLPASFAGDKVTSYGGYLSYNLNNVPAYGPRNNAADVQLISDVTFHYFGNVEPNTDGSLSARVQLLEKGWQRPDGTEVSREHFLLALSHLKTILIKASYTSNDLASIDTASIETAEPNGNGPQALHVEQCVCPTGYIGTSCENCAAGYTRSMRGLYLRHCDICDCNGHSNMCHPETGECYDCADNTAGVNCEYCKDGYMKDAYGNCVYEATTSVFCDCDPRGEEVPCDSSGTCRCKQNVEGASCDRCRPGTFGLDSANPLGCLSCYCSGATSDCHEATHYSRIAMAAPIFGENNGGYSLMDLYASEVINDQFVPAPHESELMYVFSSRPYKDLYWSLPVFPGNRVLSYGGTLALTQKYETGGRPDQANAVVILVGDRKSLNWTSPTPMASGEALSFQIPLREGNWYVMNSGIPASREDMMSILKDLKRVLVKATLSPDITSSAIADVSMDTATEIYDTGAQAAKGVEICMCPNGYIGTSCEDCAPGYYKDDTGLCKQCNCNGHNCQLGVYNEVVCSCRPPYTGPDCSTVAGEPVKNETSTPPPPQTTVFVKISSPSIKIQEVGSTVNFTCEAQSRYTQNTLPVNWTKVDGYLPLERTYINSKTGELFISNLQISDSGEYICQTSDGISTGQAIATLKVPGNEMTLPTVTIIPSINDYYEGDRIELQCQVTGNPAPRITWQRASRRPLPRASRVDSRFIIESAIEEDSGEYRCIASNAVGSTDRSAVVTVRPRPSWPQRDKLTVSTSAVNVTEGQSTRVVCTGTTNVPAGTIEWIRQDGANLLKNVRSDNGVLYIEYATPENQGVYVCQTVSTDVVPIPVVVTIIPIGTPSPNEASNVTASVAHLKLPTGGSGSVDCYASGYPLPLVRWTKYSESFGPGVSQRDNSLIISNAQDSDQGYYLCEGTVNGARVAYANVYVEIEKREPPLLEIWPQGEQAVALGGQTRLMCRVLAGAPEPVVMWSRGGARPLSAHAQLQPNHVLNFEKIEVNDEGEYICSATNEAGTSSASAVIKVRSPPEIIITPSNYVQAVRGDSINIECRASGYPEPLVSIKTSPGLREVVPATPGIAALRIPSVNERDESDYVCTATSAAGTIDEPFGLRVDRGDGGFNDIEGSGEGGLNIDDEYDNRPSTSIAIEGRDARLSCNASNEFEVRWRKANSASMEYNVDPRGSDLIVRNVTKANSGTYECLFVSRRTGEVQHASSIKLEVMSAPIITLRPLTQTVQPGQSPTVECVVSGPDIQDIIWRPVNRQPSSRVEIRGSTLIFHQIEVEDAGQYECFARNPFANASAVAEVVVSGPREQTPALVAIDQPRRDYRVGENVEVMCKSSSRDTKVTWERYGTNQYVASRAYGDGALLVLQGVEESDAGLYRCTGQDPYGRTFYEDFNLTVVPGSNYPPYPIANQPQAYTARLRDFVSLPCNHNLEQPVSIEWSKEYAQLPPNVRSNDPVLNLDSVTESDAGTYICRVTNNRAIVGVRAILRVTGVVPKFNGDGWLSLPTLKDAYMNFDIEVSFKPNDPNGLILYNGQNDDRTGDYIALQLTDGVPTFEFDTGSGPHTVSGDRPLQLNTWHTIRIIRTNSKVTMDVDNKGPFITEWTTQWHVLDLKQPLYIGGVPDYNQLPSQLAGASGFIGCVSMLILGKEEINIMVNSSERENVMECDSCVPNLCLHDGVCQEARNERGYMCLCAAGYAGRNCDRTGQACRPGICGPGRCIDTADGYKCACPVTYTGKNCEQKQTIEYPAFTGSAYLAIKLPQTSHRYFRMSMKIIATPPVMDSIIMYCKARGGGFTALTVHNGKLEFRLDLGDGSPVVLTSNKSLPPNTWTDIHIARVGADVSMKINMIETYEHKLASYKQEMILDTPMFIGGVDESVVINNSTGVTGGFSGCIKDLRLHGDQVDIASSSIQAVKVQECPNFDRGDIPEMESVCSQCRNGGQCTTPDATACSCPAGYTGTYCETRATYRQQPSDPCAARPCYNGGVCRFDRSSTNNFTCDCPLGFTGRSCQMRLDLVQSVGFNGNGYIELPGSLLNYEQLEEEPALIALAIHTNQDGVLVYQHEAQAPPGRGDFILLRIENGIVVLDWDLGSGLSSLRIEDVHVNDGERHQIIAKLQSDSQVYLAVDQSAKTGSSTGFTNVMNADSNIYVGGIPDRLNYQQYPGLVGCIEQVELTSSGRALNLGLVAVAGRNTQRCME